MKRNKGKPVKYLKLDLPEGKSLRILRKNSRDLVPRLTRLGKAEQNASSCDYEITVQKSMPVLVVPAKRARVTPLIRESLEAVMEPESYTTTPLKKSAPSGRKSA